MTREDVLEMPAAWHKTFVPRRGGTPGPALKPQRDRGAELLTAAKRTIEARLNNPDSDPELVAAAEAYLADPEGGPAMGAGAVVALVNRHLAWPHQEQAPWLADALIVERGPVFAAEAMVHSTGLDSGDHWHNARQIPPRLIRNPEHGTGWSYFPHFAGQAGQVRAHLAVAPDEVYAQAVDALSALRGAVKWRAAAAFMLPTQAAWVDEACAEAATRGDAYAAELMWRSAGTAAQLALVQPLLRAGIYWAGREASGIPTAVDGLGAAVLPALLHSLDHDHSDVEARQRLLATIAVLPSDEAFAALVERLDRRHVPLATLDAVRRFPRRALRVLAAADPANKPAADLLRMHVHTARDVVDEELPSLAPDARARVEAVIAEGAGAPEAPASALPEVLVSPPWTTRGPKAKPLVVAGLAFDGEPELRWLDGEREAWAVPPVLREPWWRLEVGIEEAVAQFRAGTLAGQHQVTLMLTAPDDVVADLLPGWRPARVWDAARWLPPLIARHGLAALGAAVHVAEKVPAANTGMLLPLASPAVAAHFATTAVRLKALRAGTLAWVERHPGYAARALAPAALGKPGPARRGAEDVLRLAAARHRDALLEAAEDSHGPQAREALTALLGADPLRLLPAKIPDLAAWAEPALMPRILLADGSGALGPDATRHVCTMLAISKPDEVYPGVAIVREACDPRSLAEFAWAMFTTWQSVGAPPKEAWPLHALRWFGDDDTVRRLAPIIRAWPGEGGHAKAVTGLDILAEIGTDIALMHLHGIAQRVKFKALKERAAEKIDEVAAGLGLSAEQLADRLVPDFGLDARGTLTLDYGPRQFVVGFDEQLRPYVTDPSGARRKDLPKPGARDDQRLAPEAYKAFAALKKDVRTVAADQIRRLETAMLTERTWPAADLRAYLVEHPLVGHITRRLVWSADGLTFRVAEDLTLADAEDEAVTLPPDATVRLVHPVRLTAGELAAWSGVFADYEILQPFPQLGRAVHALTPDELGETTLERFGGHDHPTTTLLGLERRGWHRGEPMDAGVQNWLWKPTLDGGAIVADLDPGIPIGALDISPTQRIRAIWLNTAPGGSWRPRQLTRTFATLDPLDASEMLRDLTDALAR
ncbi:DUF4132 domain-containing protein [Dactylosporangium salmoneum]